MTKLISLPLRGWPSAVPPMRSARLLLAAGIALMPTVAFAQGTREQQQACTPDTLRLCMSSIPDVAKTTACMKAHVAELSPRCQAAFNEATPKAAEPKPASRVAASKAAAPKTARAPAKPRAAAREERRSSRTVVASRQDARQGETRAERREERREAERRLPGRAPRPLARASREDEPDVALQRPVAERPMVVTPAPDDLVTPDVDGTRVALAAMCRRGLIDAYTCSNTVPSLGLGE